MSLYIAVLGTSVVVFSYMGAWWARTHNGVRKTRQQTISDAFGVLFSIAIFVVVEALLDALTGASFFTLLRSGSVTPLVVFVAGCVMGMAYEYLGQCSLRWWHYPSVERRRYLLALLPLFWGLFMLIMHDTYAILRALGYGTIIAAVGATFIQGILIEGINLLTRSWAYTGWGSSLFILVPGWVILLGFVFVVWFNQFLLNPFGF